LRNGGHVDDLYSALLRVSQRGPSPPTPKPLAQLANILAFRLFVTTTFDSLLDHALQEARPGTNIDVRSFSLRHQPNLEAPITASEVTIYHLFGTLGPVPDCYPLTQEDLIEFMFALRSEIRPEKLYNELAEKSLLILGSRFSGWLARFFLRLPRQKRLSVRTKFPSFVADADISGDETMIFFLDNFSRNIRVFPARSPVEFVDELASRWAAHLTPPDPSPVNSGSNDGPTPFIFISYASEDVRVAEAIQTALQKAGVTAFFDRDQDGGGLRGGDNWEPKLRKRILHCSLFMAILSKHVLDPGPRYFRAEWDLGLRQFKLSRAYISPEDTYLLPVVIDGTKHREDGIPEDFEKAQWIELSAGSPTSVDAFVALVRQKYRRQQAAAAGGQ
jgi:hypothetical protein